ncbi:flagellar biosynthetic protein FliP [Iodidimonas muriae]|uniref:Flagellar biosynthetic protein FliP n=2 Tax=Iodidimonas muriae TaxID=261467 RepID=A0ABQ2LFV1_9PROT|nr:flagellar type III secretion system pore protein FliP [Iodidimonas muriae]GER08641.1 flagellar biosynthetic protein FliP [Kordiimonadales bacterium JCM 17843]GGO15692.1 flagellar biosynthetic protein FliP [Iodidimonas muriae]
MSQAARTWPHKWLLPFAAVSIAMLLMLVWQAPAFAQSLSIDMGQDGTLTGRVVQLLLLVTVLTLAPSILIVMTSFTRMVVVLSLLRSALGTQQTPPNVVLISLALFLTGFIMAPTLQAAWQQGVQPMIDEEITPAEAFPAATGPFKDFMLANVREKDLELFLDAADTERPETPQAVPLTSLIPAFVISELKRAFEIGFLIYIPFIVIDLVIASILMSMGMMMLPPVLISLPFKLIFFVLVDGWHLVAGSLLKSFNGG